MLDRGSSPTSRSSTTTPMCISTGDARDRYRIYIHGSTASRAVRALAAGASACVTVTIVDALVLARSAFEHSANYDSVMAFGTFAPVEDDAERLRAFEAFTEKLLPERWSEVRHPNATELKATEILALEIGDASVKMRTGPPDDDDSADATRPGRASSRSSAPTAPQRPRRGRLAGHPALSERAPVAHSASSSWMIRGEAWTQTRSTGPSASSSRRSSSTRNPPRTVARDSEVRRRLD